MDSDSDSESRNVDRAPVWGTGGPWGGGSAGGAMSMSAGMAAKAEGLITDDDGEHEGHHGDGQNMFQKAGLQIASSIQAFDEHVNTVTAAAVKAAGEVSADMGTYTEYCSSESEDEGNSFM